jgi:hypothetical protein
MDCECDGACREDHAAYGKQSDRPEVEAKLTPAHLDTRRINQQRQNAKENQVRGEFETRQARNKRQAGACNIEEDGGSSVKATADNGPRGG